MSWVKLHTQLLDSRVFANEGLLKVWIYCLCRTNRSKAFVPIRTGRGETEIEIQPGQFLFGRNEAAKKLKMNPSTVWKRMIKLKNMGNVDIQSGSHFSLVTICNWETYQYVPNEKEQSKEQASNRQGTGKEQASNTDKSKESNKSKETKPTNGVSEKVKFKPPESLSSKSGFLDVWKEWEAHRRAIGKKMTGHAAKRIFSKLEKCNNPIEVLNKSIENGWTGIFTEETQQNSPPPGFPTK